MRELAGFVPHLSVRPDPSELERRALGVQPRLHVERAVSVGHVQHAQQRPTRVFSRQRRHLQLHGPDVRAQLVRIGLVRNMPVGADVLVG